WRRSRMRCTGSTASAGWPGGRRVRDECGEVHPGPDRVVSSGHAGAVPGAEAQPAGEDVGGGGGLGRAVLGAAPSVAGRVRRGAGGPQRASQGGEGAAAGGPGRRGGSGERAGRDRVGGGRAVHGRAGPGRTPPLTTPQFRSSSLPWSVRDGHSATTRAPRVGSRELTSPRP